MTSLFGTSGIRGPDAFFTNQFCFDIGRTFAKFLDSYKQGGPIAVGMDPRKSSPKIKQALFQGLAYERRQLFDEGIAPIPAMNLILKASSCAGSVMVTGSHVKEGLNGLKFFAFKEEILKDHEEEISRIYGGLKEEVAYQKKKLKVKKEDRANKLYKKMLIDLTDKPLPSLKVVVSLSNGAQSKVIPLVLEKLSLQVIAVHDDPTKPFIVLDTESETGEGLKFLTNLVKKEKADLAMAYDVDGDRVVFLDENGQFIPGDYSGALLAKHGDTKLVITPINTSQVAEYLGKPVLRTKVGSPFVVEAMQDHGATFGFEANGGGISQDVMMSRDGGSTMIKILNLMKKESKSLSSLVATLPRFHIYRTKVDCPQELNDYILKSAKKEFKGIKIEEVDGLKIWTDKTSWILYRPSRNAPEFRVFAEAKDRQKATKLGQNGIKFVKEKIRQEG